MFRCSYLVLSLLGGYFVTWSLLPCLILRRLLLCVLLGRNFFGDLARCGDRQLLIKCASSRYWKLTVVEKCDAWCGSPYIEGKEGLPPGCAYSSEIGGAR